MYVLFVDFFFGLSHFLDSGAFLREPCRRCSSAVPQMFVRRAAKSFLPYSRLFSAVQQISVSNLQNEELRFAFFVFRLKKTFFFLSSSLFWAPLFLFLKNAYKDFGVEDLFLCCASLLLKFAFKRQLFYFMFYFPNPTPNPTLQTSASRAKSSDAEGQCS